MPKIVKKLRKSGSGGCFGRSGGLPGAMSSRLGRRSAKMHTRSPQIGQFGGILEVKLGLKFQKKSIKKQSPKMETVLAAMLERFWSIFCAKLGRENRSKKASKNDATKKAPRWAKGWSKSLRGRATTGAWTHSEVYPFIQG